MMTLLTAMTLLATTAMPPPPGVRAASPSLQESLGYVRPLLAFDGTYDVPFAEARVRFEGYARAQGWVGERAVVLGERQGVVTDLALSFTNRTERLAALLSSIRPRRTTLKYQIEPKAGAKRPPEVAKDVRN